jgi:hypothetical protein
MPRALTNAEVVREISRRSFGQIELSETRYFEKYDSALLEVCFRIAAENLRNGKQLSDSSEETLRKYIGGIIRKKSRLTTVKSTKSGALVSTQFCFYADYKVTEADKRRFQERLERSGDCLLYKGLSATEYRRFWVNKKSIGAHRFGYFSQVGYLPAPRELGGRNGLQVAHNCGNPACCNPRHLRLTTKSVNLLERRPYGKPAQDTAIDDYGSTDGSVQSRCSYVNSEVCPEQSSEDPLAVPLVSQSYVNRELGDSPTYSLSSSPREDAQQYFEDPSATQGHEITRGVTGDDEITI